MNRVRRNPNDELQRIQLGMFPNSGGLPIVVNKQMIGVDRHRRLRAARAGLERRDLRPQGDAGGARRGERAAAGRGPAESAGTPLPRTRRRFRVSRPRPRRRRACRTRSGWSAAAARRTSSTATRSRWPTAKKVARVCRDFAAAKGGSVSIYILDTHGELVHMERIDGQDTQQHPHRDAEGRDVAAARACRRRSTPRRDGTIPAACRARSRSTSFFTNSGGLPIVVDGQMIGVDRRRRRRGGGGDENCAIEGLKATFGEHVTLPVYPAAKPAPAATATGATR